MAAPKRAQSVINDGVEHNRDIEALALVCTCESGELGADFEHPGSQATMTGPLAEIRTQLPDQSNPWELP